MRAKTKTQPRVNRICIVCDTFDPVNGVECEVCKTYVCERHDDFVKDPNGMSITVCRECHTSGAFVEWLQDRVQKLEQRVFDANSDKKFLAHALLTALSLDDIEMVKSYLRRTLEWTEMTSREKTEHILSDPDGVAYRKNKWTNPKGN